MLVGLVLGIGIVVGTRRWDRSRAIRLGVHALVFAWVLVSGVLGGISLALWTLTDHWATAWNENLLHFSPAALALAAALPFALRGGPRAMNTVRVLALAIAAGSAFGAVLQLLPWFSQVNGPIVAAGLPLNLGLAVFALRLRGASAGRRNAPSGGRSVGH
jgi:hypothetical protein